MTRQYCPFCLYGAAGSRASMCQTSMRCQTRSPLRFFESWPPPATKKAFTADGVSVRQNNDPAGGQNVIRVHFHVVPRFAGDDFDVAEYQRLSERTRIDQAEAMRRAWRG